MATNRVIKLWTVIITAFLAVLTAMGLTSPAAAATPVQQTEGIRNAAVSTPAATSVRAPWAFKRSLPPTMKQRIRAEAHGSSPSCRHRLPAETEPGNEFDETAAGINALHAQA
ncbi:DUF6344 domain-containing protein [Streptomyces sp. NPDC058067]|uniref:Secreted protein n=1 Tax=Streptomyces antnestii TaxID=2494256 RepID=A0A3S2XWX8_9ACTN|nr:DUF6344 domain-containing protein [Streptomyces sp. San01]RVU27293.1 hypothetical protein EOT10_08965 [Streptomyces sp. San01]